MEVKNFLKSKDKKTLKTDILKGTDDSIKIIEQM